MKSERAKETLDNSAKVDKTHKPRGCGEIIETYIFKPNAELAVERAEEDARERAITATRAICEWRGTASTWDGKECCVNAGTLHRDCNSAQCHHIYQFLKHYDNGE